MTAVHPIPNEPDLEQPPTHAYEPRPHPNGHQPHHTAPPHDAWAERALLGAALLHGPDDLHDVPPDAFYVHGHIAHAITTLANQGAYIDAGTVHAELQRTGLTDRAGGPEVLLELLRDAPTSHATPTYARIVLDHWHARQLRTAGEEIARAAQHDGATAAWARLQAANNITTATSDVPWEDVTEVLTGDYQPMRPTILTRTDGQALIYPGLLHWLMGEPGKGKTWVAIYATTEQLAAGHHVIYLDWEGNRQIIAERLTALGCTIDHLQRLHYLRPPRITPALARAIADRAANVGATLAVCDGVAKALARNDLDEDKAPQILRWLELVTHPINETGAAVLVLDHVTKDKETRGLWPRGSGAKQGEVSGAAWLVKPRRPFSRHQDGEITLIQAKDREGHVGVDGDAVARILLTPKHDGAQLDIQVLAPAPQSNEFRPTHLMELLSIEIGRANAAGGTPNTNALFRIVPGKKEHKQIALQRLIQERHVTTEDGPRASTLHTLVTPYEETHDPLSDRFTPTEPTLEEDPAWAEF